MSDTSDAAEEKITVRLPAALLARVDEAAQERGVRRSEFVRQALTGHAETVLRRGAEDDVTTLYDVLSADGVLGRFSGPPGLSTTSRDALRQRMRARKVGPEPARPGSGT